MENDIAKLIETATPTNNGGKEEDNIPVELVDEEERFQDGYRDREQVTIKFQIKYKYNKNQLPTCC